MEANNANKDAVQKLREATGAGVMECHRALKDAGGDFAKAAALIGEQGLSKVEKRAGRETSAGLVHAYVHGERIGVLLHVSAETDFVVRSEPFKALAHELAMHIAAAAPKDIAELLGQPYIRDEKKTVNDLIGEVIAKVGENIQVKEFYRIEL
ncbi:MAG: translation elongation factor Ts [Candidatus Liptonbacteria bacterium]|nr:translation elongation factor Ts [Candidatus Liptonbacteria bacterium]